MLSASASREASVRSRELLHHLYRGTRSPQISALAALTVKSKRVAPRRSTRTHGTVHDSSESGIQGLEFAPDLLMDEPDGLAVNKIPALGIAAVIVANRLVIHRAVSGRPVIGIQPRRIIMGHPTQFACGEFTVLVPHRVKEAEGVRR